MTTRRVTRDVLGGLNVRVAATAGLVFAAVVVVTVAAVALIRSDDDPADRELAGGGPPSTTEPSPEGSRPPVTTSEPPPATTPPDPGPPRDMDDVLLVTDARVGRYEDADRFVIEFNQNLEGEEVTEAEDMLWSDGVTLVVDDAPYLAECVEPSFSEEVSTFVNVQVPSSYPDLWDIALEPVYRSEDTAKLLEAALICVYEGKAYFAASLTQAGEVDAFILDNPGRLVIDIR